MKLQKVTVVGQGYVGLPLALALSDFGHQVVGYDTDAEKVALINHGVSPIEDIQNDYLLDLIAKRKYQASNEAADIFDSEIYIVCVPTPIIENKKPDLSYLQAAIELIGKNLSRTNMVIIESTIAPGTTRNFILPILLKLSGLTIDDFDLCFSPERIDPSNKTWNITNTPKIVAGLSEISKVRGYTFYSQIIKNVIETPSLEVAETAKLLENTFRFINISFINEMLMFCAKLGIEINDVIEASATKPYGFMKFMPSLGIGGHCIPVDPFYLADTARSLNSPLSFINTAEVVNDNMPEYFAKRARLILNDLLNKKIMILGVAYKPNVSDVRETPVKALIKILRSEGAIVNWHDELVGSWMNEKSTDLTPDYDLAILATKHDYFELKALGSVPILNTNKSI
jgi:UDP-N-acetyl-D-glucosamine dehydrogenase